MLNWLIRRRIDAFQARYDYDMSYARELARVDRDAIFALGGVQKLSRYRKDVPADVFWAAKIVGGIREDCGPCTQLVVRMALEARVDPAILAAVVRGDDAALPERVQLGVRFARAVLARTSDAEDLRDEIAKRWGARAVVSLAFGLVVSRIYPTLKYALGHGTACTRVVVDGQPIAVHAATA